MLGGLGIVPSPERLLLAVKISLWWCGWFLPRLNIARIGAGLERPDLSGRSRLIGLEIERDPVPPEPGLEVRDLLLLCVELLLLALHLGRTAETEETGREVVFGYYRGVTGEDNIGDAKIRQGVDDVTLQENISPDYIDDNVLDNMDINPTLSGPDFKNLHGSESVIDA